MTHLKRCCIHECTATYREHEQKDATKIGRDNSGFLAVKIRIDFDIYHKSKRRNGGFFEWLKLYIKGKRIQEIILNGLIEIIWLFTKICRES